MHKLSDLEIPVIVHVILGLPGETAELMYSTIEYLNTFRVFGIKLQLLHVLRGTDLAADYEARNFDVLTLEEYVELVIGCLERIDPEVVIHRVMGAYSYWSVAVSRKIALSFLPIAMANWSMIPQFTPLYLFSEYCPKRAIS